MYVYALRKCQPVFSKAICRILPTVNKRLDEWVVEDRVDLGTLMPPEPKKGSRNLTKRDALAVQESNNTKTKSEVKV